ncbi:MAG: glycosyltransferase family 2 protein [Steroidobacteraceae bacterium]|nr:glycosyltransferase family 2 protein [Steroidobacteraceae bacterium]
MSVARPLLSIVIPAHDEEHGIPWMIRAVADVMARLAYPYEIVVVDDGSRDATFERAAECAHAGVTVRAIRLSRNFGKEAALCAGLEAARGAAVITIDADLQHPPSTIPRMVEAWERGARIVHGVKRSRGDERWYATARAKLVNALIGRLGGIELRNASDFKLLDRQVVDVLVHELPERHRFYRGLAQWIGFEQACVEFDVAPRRVGVSHWSLSGLVGLAWTATVSFSAAPLRVVGYLGVLTLLMGLVIGGEAIWSWANGIAVSGFATTIMTLLLIGSFVMISLGVIGEYIAKIYDEIKHRPPYVVACRREPPDAAAADAPGVDAATVRSTGAAGGIRAI